ncbi:alcohol dehydrogenase GroES-like domain-containing protein [Colletotrichum navitas]|uniref:Alcohol dehydrogenase GroES-like domain-containing protein n=1 Tax=Colletotrichum navitas TaxID=681940 RepID=A0AAD8V1H1_9PEZI|nr:alcohol dehydrogenase GroES-like domain-containing protein [Colletotrichum navitas]KAK1574319.1 alcohol dehydrogenase GroES-like domain-containing protein [Colletotrichum navitas]
MTDHHASRPKTMRSVFWDGKPFEVTVKAGIPLPRIKAPEDAIVRITTSAICGTDLHTYHGILSSAEVPFPIGHEAIGIVEEVGDAVDNLQVGDRVVIWAEDEEGEINTDNQISLNFAGFGFGKDFGDLGGLQAEYARVPFADNTLIKIPKKLADKEWLFISDIFTTAWEGLNWSGFQPGDSVAVFGAGPVGLLCAYSAIIRGASVVYSIDHIPQRLAKAASIGAVPINFTKGGSASEQILALQPGGVNRCVDCCGEECINTELKPQQDFIIREAIAITSIGGGIGVPGVHWAQQKSAGAPNADKIKRNISFPISDFWLKNLTIRAGIVDGRNTFAALVKLVESGHARPGFIVTAEFDLSDAAKAYKRFDEKLEVKVLFRGAGKEGRDDYDWDEWKDNEEAGQKRTVEQ